MSEIADTPQDVAPPSKKKVLIPAAIALLALGGGFASTYLDLWSPAALLQGSEDKKKDAEPAVPAVAFVEVPRIVTTLAGERPRQLLLTAQLETTPEKQAEVAHLLPRVQDAYNDFLAGIDPLAFQRRGILEIIRTELVTRTRYVMGDDMVDDVLITEFALQ